MISASSITAEPDSRARDLKSSVKAARKRRADSAVSQSAEASSRPIGTASLSTTSGPIDTVTARVQSSYTSWRPAYICPALRSIAPPGSALKARSSSVIAASSRPGSPVAAASEPRAPSNAASVRNRGSRKAGAPTRSSCRRSATSLPGSMGVSSRQRIRPEPASDSRQAKACGRSGKQCGWRATRSAATSSAVRRPSQALRAAASASGISAGGS